MRPFAAVRSLQKAAKSRMPSRQLTMPVPEGFYERRDDDGSSRLVCKSCGFVNYRNPKVVVGSVPTYRDPAGHLSVLLVRRSIWPREGFWTIPAGYMELGETTEQGAAREAREEANADISIESLLAVYTVPRISIVQVFYRSSLIEPKFSVGPEALDVKLFPISEIPWHHLAFPTVNWALYNRFLSETLVEKEVFSNPQTTNGDTDVWYNPADGKLSSAQ